MVGIGPRIHGRRDGHSHVVSAAAGLRLNLGADYGRALVQRAGAGGDEHILLTGEQGTSIQVTADQQK